MDIKKLLKSFRFAGGGVLSVFKTEQNFRIEVLVTIVVVSLMIYLPLTSVEVAIMSLAISAVLTMEIINTVVERLLDMNTRRKSKSFKFLKDIMAAAVLINVLWAVLIGVVIFGPYLFE